MNAKTMEKLRKNPHYIISGKNYKDLKDEEKEPMVEFGVVPSNRLPINTNQRTIRRIQRTGKVLED